MTRKNIAIIGTGISGLGAAYLLNPHHAITVYEKNATLGGHSRTMEVKTDDGIVPVDTGFIVYNEKNYPHLTGLFNHLNVPTQDSEMSFGVSIDNHWLEYGTQLAHHIVAQKRNLLRPSFWGMMRDILKFNKHAEAYITDPRDLSLGECLDELKMGAWFRNYYLLAMGAAIWSTPATKMSDFPARTFLQFFKNHGLLTLLDHPQWRTIEGGSREYVRRISADFTENIKLKCGAKKVRRTKAAIEVEDEHGETRTYDEVVFACHSDQALRMLDAPTDNEQQILGNIHYQPNTGVLHRDYSFMPKRKGAWSSWVYLSETRKDTSNNVSLSYWMNNLQPLKTKQDIIVTLNPHRAPDPDLTYDTHVFHHPVFDGPAIAAQKRIPEIQGVDRIWYCGAWQRYGFHEDGLLSAVMVAEKMGITPPWK